MMNIIAPLPKKPSYIKSYVWMESDNDDEACQELRQILNSHSSMMEDLTTIIRTNNPLPNDTCFVPTIHQFTTTTTVSEKNNNHRPRSFSVGASRYFYSTASNDSVVSNGGNNLVH
ncbi:uncharacterized protein BX663DRAFT_498593 [Cokeromyces recurvatus]|uniref:uncharacterized protein n=1 Tax=Cokeromyces recurvatus TaxID=90255 RepID=UPI00221FD3B6|nr:uncharacterized protein BX663DRAFT_498593 [Cokeromyces recurvatus]KAI7906048.1 hypothetical protein BX663DRAFT_498593 [Cokeromyces recurvatus]